MRRLEQIQVAALQKAKSVGSEVASQNAVLSAQIVELFTGRNMTMDQVAETLAEDLPDAQSLSSRRTIVRAVLRQHLEESEIAECTSRNRANHRRATRSITDGKRKSDEERGLVSFTPEENVAFWNYINNDPSCRRGGDERRINHKVLFERMHARFPDRPFTPDLLRERYAKKCGLSSYADDVQILKQRVDIQPA